MEDILSKLGMQRDLIRQLCLILKNIQDLLMGVQAGTVLGETCRTKLPETLPVENSLAQLLYVYLVQWIGE